MWKCEKCGLPVYFAERRQSLGFDWHRQCLRCQECDKVLNPGQHAERKGSPFCHVPCYSALFGPRLFGHGSRVESHKSFGRRQNSFYEDEINKEAQKKLKDYNQYISDIEGVKRILSSRVVNGRLLFEGLLRVYWGVEKSICLREYNDNRHIVKANRSKSSSYAHESRTDDDDEEDNETDILPRSRSFRSYPQVSSHSFARKGRSLRRSNTLPPVLSEKSLIPWDEFDELLSVERPISAKDRVYHTVHSDLTLLDKKEEEKARLSIFKVFGKDSSRFKVQNLEETTSKTLPQSKIMRGTGPRALRRRCKKRFDRSKLKRRCSMNGHWYDRDTSIFTPPKDSPMSVRVSSTYTTNEVVKLLLDKYQVISGIERFAMYVIKENGERRLINDHESPLQLRLDLGPREEISKLYILDRNITDEISHEVAQFLRLSYAECRAILNMYYEEEEREILKIQIKYQTMKVIIAQRQKELKEVYSITIGH